MIVAALIVLIVISWGFWVVAWVFTYDFFRHPQMPLEGFTPPISILKPIKGMELDLYDLLLGFVHQDYPEHELLLGVLSLDDPAMVVLARLEREFPDKVRVVVADPVGLNNKVSILSALAAEARYPMLLVSDSDMHVTPDYLRRVVSPMHDPKVGLVTSPYMGDRPLTLTAWLEALYMGTTFLPMTMMARRYLTKGYAMGSTGVVRAADIERIGGFEALANYLADDYELGHQIGKLGLHTHMSDYVTRAVLGATTFREQWDREVRWMRCTRVSRPTEYPAVLVTLSTPLALLLLIFSGFSTEAALVFAATLVLRWWVAWQVSGYTGDQVSRRRIWLLPVRDALTGGVWLAGGFGRTVGWRGQRYSLTRDGQMGPLRVSRFSRWRRA